MLLELILFCLLGILLGTITGLTPGIHINLIGTLLVSLSAGLIAKVPVLDLSVLIVAMAITHTFVDFIPSIFLGCPDTDTMLAILPGHQLLKKGRAYEAVSLTAYGGLVAVGLLLLILIPSINFVPKIYSVIKSAMPFILIGASLLLVIFEKRKIVALFVLIFTGALGLSVLNMPSLNQPLLPLLTGLFGSSMLVMSIKSKVEIPKQKITKPKNMKFLKPILGSLIASPLCSFLPGLGSGQAAIIGNKVALIKETNRKQFLILLGATNTLVMGFSFVSLYAISKTRTGAASALQQIIGNINLHTLTLIIIVASLASIAAFFVTLNLTKVFSKYIEKVNYSVLSVITLTILSIVVFAISGFLGLAVLIVSTFAGLYCISLGVRRTNMMGCLLIPTILFYLVGI